MITTRIVKALNRHNNIVFIIQIRKRWLFIPFWSNYTKAVWNVNRGEYTHTVVEFTEKESAEKVRNQLEEIQETL